MNSTPLKTSEPFHREPGAQKAPAAAANRLEDRHNPKPEQGFEQYCLALDLIDDPALIREYEQWHTNGWPEVKKSILESGIREMEIYRTGNRLFMLIRTEPNFSFEKKAASDAVNPKVQEWEALMWKFQQPLPWAKEGQKWIVMDRIFRL